MFLLNVGIHLEVRTATTQKTAMETVTTPEHINSRSYLTTEILNTRRRLSSTRAATDFYYFIPSQYLAAVRST
jgi:hypothetical protein